jgi:hypothetical protein
MCIKRQCTYHSHLFYEDSQEGEDISRSCHLMPCVRGYWQHGTSQGELLELYKTHTSEPNLFKQQETSDLISLSDAWGTFEPNNYIYRNQQCNAMQYVLVWSHPLCSVSAKCNYFHHMYALSHTGKCWNDINWPNLQITILKKKFTQLRAYHGHTEISDNFLPSVT